MTAAQPTLRIINIAIRRQIYFKNISLLQLKVEIQKA